MAQHDLRSPIAGIVSFASSLLSDTEVSANHKEIVKYIEQAAYSVLNMVNLRQAITLAHELVNAVFFCHGGKGRLDGRQ